LHSSGDDIEVSKFTSEDFKMKKFIFTAALAVSNIALAGRKSFDVDQNAIYTQSCRIKIRDGDLNSTQNPTTLLREDAIQFQLSKCKIEKSYDSAGNPILGQGVCANLISDFTDQFHLFLNVGDFKVDQYIAIFSWTPMFGFNGNQVPTSYKNYPLVLADLQSLRDLNIRNFGMAYAPCFAIKNTANICPKIADNRNTETHSLNQTPIVVDQVRGRIDFGGYVEQSFFNVIGKTLSFECKVSVQ
jgi:hypothetical protein